MVLTALLYSAAMARASPHNALQDELAQATSPIHIAAPILALSGHNVLQRAIVRWAFALPRLCWNGHYGMWLFDKPGMPSSLPQACNINRSISTYWAMTGEYDSVFYAKE
jgi:hypothetical protein